MIDCKNIYQKNIIPFYYIVLYLLTSNIVRSRIVQISEKSITAYNNKNLTIICSVDLNNSTYFMRYNNNNDNSTSTATGIDNISQQNMDRVQLSFSTNARMVLTFMTRPRNKKPLHQFQSFLHCIDPNRTKCLSEFNFDISCIEDQMDNRYLRYDSYWLEAACQVDDFEICGAQWSINYPTDCYDLADVNVINGK